MPILILINVQYLQKVVFSFEKGQMVKTLLLRFSPPDKKIPPPAKFLMPTPLNTVWKSM